MPFDRLISAMDQWAENHSESKIFAQIGTSQFVPKSMKYATMLSPLEYHQRCSKADLLVSHLGMGTLLTAIELGKRLVVLPRKVELKEVTSAHQWAAARWLEGRSGIRIAFDEHHLDEAIDAVLKDEPPTAILSESLERLIGRVRSFVIDS